MTSAPFNGCKTAAFGRGQGLFLDIDGLFKRGVFHNYANQAVGLGRDVKRHVVVQFGVSSEIDVIICV